VSGSAYKTIKIWDAATGQEEKTLAGHSVRLSAVAFSPDGRQIVSGSGDETIKIWDAATGQEEKTLAGHSDLISAVAFSPNGRQIVSGSYDQTIKIWDAAIGQEEKTLAGHSGSVNAVAFSPDGRQIVSGSGDKTIKIWDATTGELEKTLAGHSNWVSAVAFSPDGRQIVSGSYDKTIKIWDATTRQLDTFESKSPATKVSDQPRSRMRWTKRISLLSHRRSNKLPDLVNISRSRSHDPEIREIQTPGPVTQLKYSSDGTRLITNCGIWELGTVTTNSAMRTDDSPEALHVDGQWILCDNQPILRLPAGFDVTYFDVKGDQLAMGLVNGRVLAFRIDRRRVNASYSLDRRGSQ
jgi:WD40 repeat protein